MPRARFARDLWRAAMLGLDVTRPPRSISFAEISQPWLRAAAKRHARFRLGTGKREHHRHRGPLAALLLPVPGRAASRHDRRGRPGPADPRALHLLGGHTGLAGYQTNTYLVTLRGFLEACRRHRWLPALPAEAIIYIDELPRRPRPLPRFVDEFVMAQLEDPDNLARLPDATTRNLVIVIMETGLRAFDACALPFNPVIDDSVGWPCLRYFNHRWPPNR